MDGRCTRFDRCGRRGNNIILAAVRRIRIKRFYSACLYRLHDIFYEVESNLKSILIFLRPEIYFTNSESRLIVLQSSIVYVAVIYCLCLSRHFNFVGVCLVETVVTSLVEVAKSKVLRCLKIGFDICRAVNVLLQ